MNEPAQAAATRLAVRAGLSEEQEDAGNRIERLRPDDVAAEIERAGFQVAAHVPLRDGLPGPPGLARCSTLSRAALPVSRAGMTLFNRVAHGVGNKFTIQAVR